MIVYTSENIMPAQNCKANSSRTSTVLRPIVNVLASRLHRSPPCPRTDLPPIAALSTATAARTRAADAA